MLTIKCDQCGHEIEISKALSQDIEDKIRDDISKKYTKQIEDLLDELRQMKRKDQDREIDMKRKLIEEEEKIRKMVLLKAEEDHRLKDQEKENKLLEAMKQIEELKIKMQQGSQQTQGETLELDIENRLRQEFPTDQISEVKKGVRGADINQVVVDKLGRTAGIILWESKNAQWSDGWVDKLKEDQRQAKADLAVLVSVNLPQGVNGFIYRQGIWICDLKNYLPLSFALRFNLISLHHERQSSEGKDEKMKILYQYLTGSEFKHRVEGIVEAFGNLQEELEKEKRWFSIKWARQEKEIRKVIDHTHGLYGDFQGVVGKSLPEIKSLQLPE